MGRPYKVSRERYCEFLIATHTNRTQTYFAEHTEEFAHDAVNRYLKGDQVTASEVWRKIIPELKPSQNGYLIFDDSVLDKNHSRRMELVRRQYSGNEHRVIRGIGIVNCVYVNPETDEFWIVDFCIYAPDQDGKSKVDHVMDMFQRALEREAAGLLPFRCALMDTCYATTRLLLCIDSASKYFCCPVKSNRNVCTYLEDDQQSPFQRADSIDWTGQAANTGHRIRLRSSPAGFKVKIFRVVLSTGRTELVVTNDPTLVDVEGVRMTHAFRWKVEVFHRELKQITGVQDCQCRLARAQRNHIGCSILVWIRMKQLAKQAKSSIYALKSKLLESYMRLQLASPSIPFA